MIAEFHCAAVDMGSIYLYVYTAVRPADTAGIAGSAGRVGRYDNMISRLESTLVSVQGYDFSAHFVADYQRVGNGSLGSPLVVIDV
jgi:hypothetical protein